MPLELKPPPPPEDPFDRLYYEEWGMTVQETMDRARELWETGVEIRDTVRGDGTQELEDWHAAHERAWEEFQAPKAIPRSFEKFITSDPVLREIIWDIQSRNAAAREAAGPMPTQTAYTLPEPVPVPPGEEPEDLEELFPEPKVPVFTLSESEMGWIDESLTV